MVSPSPQRAGWHQRDDNDDYYDPCYYMNDERAVQDPNCSDNEFEIRQPRNAGLHASTLQTTPPRSSPCMEDVVRRRTPTWISRLLKTNLPEGVELEDLFGNMLLLGRIADVIHGVLDSCVESKSCDARGGAYGTPSPGAPRRGITASPYSPLSSYSPSSVRPQHVSLGERPYRVMAQDYDRFCALCARLEIREDSRFSFNDVEQKGAGERIGLCLWDISNALHDKSVTGELPEYVGKVIPKFTEPNVPSPSPLKKKRGVGMGVGHGTGRDGLLTNTTPYDSTHDSRYGSPHDSRYDSPVDGGMRGAGDGWMEECLDKAVGKEGGAAYEMDASTRVLTSILTPGRGKPKHSKLLNAVMMSDFCDEEKMGGDQASPLPKIVDRLDQRQVGQRDGKAMTPETARGGRGGVKNGDTRNKTNDKKKNKTMRSDDMMVHVSKFSHDEHGEGREGGHPLHGLVSLLKPLAIAAMGAISVVVVQGVVADRRERQWRRGMAGRW